MERRFGLYNSARVAGRLVAGKGMAMLFVTATDASSSYL
jgi:hypothetical protein